MFAKNFVRLFVLSTGLLLVGSGVARAEGSVLGTWNGFYVDNRAPTTKVNVQMVVSSWDTNTNFGTGNFNGKPFTDMHYDTSGLLHWSIQSNGKTYQFTGVPHVAQDGHGNIQFSYSGGGGAAAGELSK
jgi:hypothetical protein